MKITMEDQANPLNTLIVKMKFIAVGVPEEGED
jgi:hypothetical protein